MTKIDNLYGREVKTGDLVLILDPQDYNTWDFSERLCVGGFSRFITHISPDKPYFFFKEEFIDYGPPKCINEKPSIWFPIASIVSNAKDCIIPAKARRIYIGEEEVIKALQHPSVKRYTHIAIAI
jgi:hypothetical protein